MRAPNIIIGPFKPLRRPSFPVNTELEQRQRAAQIPALRRALEAAVRNGDEQRVKVLTREVAIAMREFSDN